MSALLKFNFEETPIRIIWVGDDPWWVASDLAQALGYQQAAFMTRLLDDDEKGLQIVQTLGGPQEMTVISEGGMYNAAWTSRKPRAIRFRKWVTREVLPALRKHGYYEMPGGDPPPVQASELDPSRLVAGVSVVRLAMRLYGPVAARGLWAQVGLPPVTPDSEVGPGADPFAEPLAAFLDDKVETTIQQAGEGIGLIDIDWSTRYRIGRLLAQWGWKAANRKVAKGRTARIFSRPSSSVTIVQEPVQ